MSDDKPPPMAGYQVATAVRSALVAGIGRVAPFFTLGGHQPYAGPVCGPNPEGAKEPSPPNQGSGGTKIGSGGRERKKDAD